MPVFLYVCFFATFAPFPPPLAANACFLAGVVVQFGVVLVYSEDYWDAADEVEEEVK
jgi:hypothetical protein